LQSIDYHYNVRNWLVRINDLYQVSPASIDPVPSSLSVLEKRINEIVLKYNSQDIANGEVETEVKIDDETVDLINGIIVASQQNEVEVDLYGEGYSTATKDEEIRVDFSDQTVTESNIGASLEELETRLEQKLVQNGVTDPLVMEVLLKDLKGEYRDRWLLLRSSIGNEDNEDLFSMNFDYDYGGNIHHLEWKVASYDYRSIYDYRYDNLDRLSNANYKEYLESSTPLFPVYQRQDDFSVNNINYDIMGNITGLERRGTVAVSGTNLMNGLIDNLSYSYNGNQLTAVQDAADATAGFADGASTNQEYTYDANGNVTKDDNKHIIVSYNHLNLPKQITFTQANSTIGWLYTTAGQKVQKTVTDVNNVVTNKHYIGNVQYINTEVDFIQQQEGRIIRNLVGVDVSNNPIYDYRYEYSLKDHLGNGRIFFSDMNKDGIVEVAQNGNPNELLQQEHYYPFGMGIRGEWKFVQPQIGGTNLYQYNGIELNDDFGLNWNMAMFRTYDPALGRWGQVDPLAEILSRDSPYSGISNNPIVLNDPLGLATEGVEGREDGRVPKKKKPNPAIIGDGKGSPPVESVGDGSEDCCPGWMINGARSLQGAMALDIATLDPSDAALPKWLGHAAGWGITGAILYFGDIPDVGDIDITRPFSIPKSDPPKDYLYRAINEDDYWNITGYSPLLPKSSGGTISDHVAGKKGTQYISASETYFGVAFYDSGYGVIIIDKKALLQAGSTIVPHNNVVQSVKNAPHANRSQLINDAIRAQEVLIKGGIPTSAIRGFVPGTGMFGK